MICCHRWECKCFYWQDSVSGFCWVGCPAAVAVPVSAAAEKTLKEAVELLAERMMVVQTMVFDHAYMLDAAEYGDAVVVVEYSTVGAAPGQGDLEQASDELDG